MMSLGGWKGKSGKKMSYKHPQVGLTSKGKGMSINHKKEKASGRKTGTMATLF